MRWWPLLLALLAGGCEDDINYYPGVTTTGYVTHHARTAVTQEVLDGWDAAVERAVAHMLRYQGVTDQEIRDDVLRSVALHVYAGRDPGIGPYSGAPYNRYPSGSADFKKWILAVAWKIPESVVQAAALGHECGHFYYWITTGDYQLAASFEHTWIPPLAAGAALASVKSWEGECRCVPAEAKSAER